MQRILIVDDNEMNRMVAKKLLRDTKVMVDTAESGEKCLKKSIQTRYDVIFMDHLMPEMDGIEALKKIKAADANASIIMCSAMGQQAMVIEAIQSGAKDFIVKPFQADRVLEAVKKVVG